MIGVLFTGTSSGAILGASLYLDGLNKERIADDIADQSESGPVHFTVSDGLYGEHYGNASYWDGTYINTDSEADGTIQLVDYQFLR
ncbi:hypothetical protein MUN88_04215 [Gracilibacillus caseinilyticus]|uniref:Uncharacterized protein n=1 Tax=Gracilibacillus caseinilyticus TaxID=2932256 RepID=A0ABY4EZI4_9BACI|nr:hypothetical protein [Gracilibacillus caseinilyticus]UOQ49332.1 hypothetical protein MUN88_04215 [Gracilibacillus caseinilyticus]